LPFCRAETDVPFADCEILERPALGFCWLLFVSESCSQVCLPLHPIAIHASSIEVFALLSGLKQHLLCLLFFKLSSNELERSGDLDLNTVASHNCTACILIKHFELLEVFVGFFRIVELSGLR